MYISYIKLIIYRHITRCSKDFSHCVFFLCAESVSSEAAFLEDYVLGMGDTLEMPCDLEDHSEPVIWFKDGAALVSTNRTRVSQRMLRIINVSYEDSGVYSCRLARSNALLSNYTIRVTGEDNKGGFYNTCCPGARGKWEIVCMINR